MKYGDEDIERMFRMAITGFESARDRVSRIVDNVALPPAQQDLLVGAMTDASGGILRLSHVRDRWRGTKSGDAALAAKARRFFGEDGVSDEVTAQ